MFNDNVGSNAFLLLTIVADDSLHLGVNNTGADRDGGDLWFLDTEDISKHVQGSLRTMMQVREKDEEFV